MNECNFANCALCTSYEFRSLYRFIAIFMKKGAKKQKNSSSP